jgi:two-component system, response regulator
METRHFLLVEDNPSDVDLTKRALGRQRIANEMVVVGDGQEALDYLLGTGGAADGQLAPLPALVLLDLKLPKVDGLAVLSAIRQNERTKRLPVVILTSSNEEQDVASSYDLGVNSYVRKPVDFVQFSEAIRTLGLYWLVMNEPPPLK